MRIMAATIVYVMGLAGVFPGQAALAQDDGVELDLEALEDLRPREQAPASHEPFSRTVEFQPGEAEPSDEVTAALAALANDVKDGTERLTIVAYATPEAGGNASDARRLALRRAIKLRQILVAAGIDGTRINLQPQAPKAEGEPGGDAAQITVRQP